MRSIIILATLAIACTTVPRPSPASSPAMPTSNIEAVGQVPDAGLAATDIRDSVNTTFLKLLERDNLQAEYESYSSKAAGICIDWDTYERVNASELLRIEHYWYEYDEGTPGEMARSILTKCNEWRRNKKEQCQCQTLALNGVVTLDIPKSAVAKKSRADSAAQLIQSATFREGIAELDQMVNRKGYLSDDKTSPYLVIRDIQESQCAKYGNRSAGCQKISEAECMAGDMGLGGDDEKTDAIVRALACKKISTPYETPGSYLMLKRMELMLLAALQLEGYPSGYSLALGTVPAPQINVSVFTEKIANAHIVLFNERYFSFAYEMAKVAALSLPLKEERGVIAYDGSEEELVQFLKEHPEIEQAFRETILTFAGRANREQLIPPEIYRPLLLSFTKGIETFALAHEIGHVALHQTTEPTSPTASLNDEACKRLSGGNWIEEIEADYFAMRLMARVRDIISACGGYVNHKRQGLLIVGASEVDCGSHPMDLAYPLTPSFYFLAKEILEESCESAGAPVVAQEDAAEQRVIAFASSCAGTDTCDFVRDVRQHLSPEVLARRGHPAARTRRALAEIWQTHSDLKGFDSPISSLANGLLRNSQIMWTHVKPTMENAK